MIIDPAAREILREVTAAGTVDRSWSCEVCEHANEVDSTICAKCAAARPAERFARRNAIIKAIAAPVFAILDWITGDSQHDK